MNKVTYVLIVGIILAAILTISRQWDSIEKTVFSDGVRTSLLADIVAPTERRFVEIVPANPIPIPLDSLLYHPLDVWVQDDNMYVFDVSIQKIWRFDMDGTFLNFVGNGRGQGPGEFVTATDAVVGDGFVWVSDVNSRSISKFNISGDYLESIHVPEGPLRMTMLKDSLVVYKMGPSFPLQNIGVDGKLGREYGEFILKQGSLMDVTGSIVATDEDQVIYLAAHASYLFVFSSFGDLERIIQTTDRIPFPGNQSEMIGDGREQFTAPDQESRVRDGAVDNGLLYVTTLLNKSTADRHSMIDLYELDTGEYVKSARLPFDIKRMDVRNGDVYAVRDTSIVVFRLGN